MNTLKLYDQLIAGGCTESQARVQAESLGEISDSLSKSIDNINDNLHRIDLKLTSLDKDLLWIRVIGAAMTVAFVSYWFR